MVRAFLTAALAAVVTAACLWHAPVVLAQTGTVITNALCSSAAPPGPSTCTTCNIGWDTTLNKCIAWTCPPPATALGFNTCIAISGTGACTQNGNASAQKTCGGNNCRYKECSGTQAACGTAGPNQCAPNGVCAAGGQAYGAASYPTC